MRLVARLALPLLSACAAAQSPNPAAKGLAPEQVKRVVVAHAGAVRECYELEAQRTSAPPGTVELAWTIVPAGTVTEVSIVSSTLYDKRAEACLIRQVRGFRFPASEGPTRVDAYPFRFDQK